MKILKSKRDISDAVTARAHKFSGTMGEFLNYVRGMRREAKKNGEVLAYIAVAEQSLDQLRMLVVVSAESGSNSYVGTASTSS